ncbi:MAG: Mov34/MPN/PAD-1 family protein [Candidatus Aenigmarchaeota archaeon]|nr:Mov34/MPN/PAD-1 family protein [Candidatus Aenigmarchaeota archaeon]
MPAFRRNLTLSERALIDIATACTEVYKKEAIGLLIGVKHKKHYMVRDAINFQSAIRGYEYVNVPSIRINRVNYVLSRLTDLRVVGDFHSHPDFPSRLSPTDKKDVKKGGLALTILVVLNRIKRKAHGWKAKDKGIVGDIGNRYHMKIMAFEYDRKLEKFNKIKIVCPSLRKINRQLREKEKTRKTKTR